MNIIVIIYVQTKVHKSLTAEELSKLVGVSIMLATERYSTVEVVSRCNYC